MSTTLRSVALIASGDRGETIVVANEITPSDQNADNIETVDCTTAEIEVTGVARVVKEEDVEDEVIFVPTPMARNPLRSLRPEDVDPEPRNERESDRNLPSIQRIPPAVVAEREVQARTTIKLGQKKSAALARRIAQKQQAVKKGKKKGPRQCHVCDVWCNSPSTFFQHVGTDRHKNRVAALQNKFYCKLCLMKFENNICMGRHLQGKRHRSRVNEEAELQNMYLMGLNE